MAVTLDGVWPPFHQQLFIYSARRIFENSIKDHYSLQARGRAVTGYNGVLGDCTGFHFEKPRPGNLYETWTAGSYWEFGGLFFNY